MNHIRKMSEVQSIKANGVKVSVKPQSEAFDSVLCEIFSFPVLFLELNRTRN